ncbi:uncharacterized protein [Penaeus vannamei]|uniref:uncharacterized protein n=1 Tax=Penaeus vannamei TaxID=6689 RepID=UPI00387F5B9E
MTMQRYALIQNCVRCRSFSAQPMTQEIADLPEECVTSNVPPFTRGLTYFGPFLVKKGRSTLKLYGVIFTCLVTRAIHIELVESMVTEFGRFIARRGPVTLIRSDNGTNLVGAEELCEELRKMKHSVIPEVMLLKDVTWQFNPPHASHFGSVGAMINGRPLTRVTDNSDGPQLLTPNMLLTLKGAGSPITDTDHSDLHVRRRWK